MCQTTYSPDFDLTAKETLSTELVSNLVYMKWLEDFTLHIPTFSDDFWKYVKCEISDYDEEKIRQLSLFLHGILNYCKSYLIDTHFGGEFETNRVHIKFNGVGYSLGLVTSENKYVYVSREIINPDSINFLDIVHSIAPDNLQLKYELLKSFECQIETMKKYGVPKSELVNILHMYYK